MRLFFSSILFLSLAVACTESADPTPPTDTASDISDAGTNTDTGTVADVNRVDDTTVIDVAAAPDSNTPDTAPSDATVAPVALGGCCDPTLGNEACEGLLICLEVPGGTPTCHQPAGNAVCNMDADCGVGGVCEGVQLCDCQVDCMTQMGTCSVTGFPKACCSNNKDCGDAG